MSIETDKEIALQRATTWFAKLDSGQVTDEVQAQFFAWLQENETNQQAYIKIEQLSDQLELIERLPINDMLDSSGSITGFVRGWPRFGAALSFLAIFTIAIFYAYLPASVSEQHYVSAVGERLDFRLKDGSSLHLNTDSAVSVRMDTSYRLLTLHKGEAYFDIAPDADRPLTVQSASGIVRVLGTQFNIRQTESGSIISVVEGRVAVTAQRTVSPPDVLAFEPELTLIANQQASLIEDQAVTAATEIDSSIAMAWRQGQLIYENNTLADVIYDLNRNFPGTIKLDDPSLADLEIIGVINLQSKAATLAALEATFDVQVVVVRDDLTLIQPRD